MARKANTDHEKRWSSKCRKENDESSSNDLSITYYIVLKMVWSVMMMITTRLMCVCIMRFLRQLHQHWYLGIFKIPLREMPFQGRDRNEENILFWFVYGCFNYLSTYYFLIWTPLLSYFPHVCYLMGWIFFFYYKSTNWA